MAKNILIFSDGTGQRAGIRVDERRSNVYKLYRATRCGPDSTVDPRRQFAFYDPGIGTLPDGMGFLKGAWRKAYNMVSQATGYGITMNVVDCYAAIISVWEPGDRIYLFGFSRGAYTVRCLASVLRLCGVPTRQRDGQKMCYDSKTARKIAKEAVKKVYQHVSSPKDHSFVPQRLALAKQFREAYQSGGDSSNAEPYFVGVFDTVAALANYTRMVPVALVWGAIVTVLSLALTVALGQLHLQFPQLPNLSFWQLAGGLTAVSIVAAASAFVLNNLKFAFGLEGFPFLKTLHFNPWKFSFYDNQLSPGVKFARHALSIDEYRADFNRVPWGEPNMWPRREPGEPAWLRQLWFAGNHSDIGGSYPEDEARLSDISLKWMFEEAKGLPQPVLFNESFLHTFPDAKGMQHDERKASWVFRLSAPFVREINPEAVLHESVIERLEAPNVLQFDIREPYRPSGLAQHSIAKRYFTPKER